MSYKKYIDLFQHRMHNKQTTEDRKLLADKDTYLNFLEVQLEKVSNAIINVNEVVETTKDLKTQVVELTEKMNNSTKLLKLIQSFVDAQEEDNVKVHQRIRLLTSRVENSNDEENKQNELERKMFNMLEQKDPSWKVQSPVHAVSRDRDVERTLREIDSRITEHLNQSIDKQFSYMKEFEERIQSQNEKFCKDIALDIKTLEIRTNEFMRRVEERTGQTRSKEPNDSKTSRGYKEELDQKIEGIISELSNTVTPKELEQFKDTIVREISKHQQNFERLDGRLFESQKVVSDLNRKLIQVEKMMFNSDLPLTIEHLEKGDKANGSDLSPINRNIKDIYNRIKNLEDSRGNYSKSDGIRQSHADNSLAEEIERRVSEKYSSQLDRIGDVVKKVLKRQQELENSIEIFSGRLPRVQSTNDTLRIKETTFQSPSILKSPAHDSGPSIRSQPTEQTPKQKNQSKSTTPKAVEGSQQIENPFLKAKYTSGDRIEIPLGQLQAQNSKDSNKFVYESLEKDVHTSFGTTKHKGGKEPKWFGNIDTNELEALLSKKKDILTTLQAKRPEKKSSSKTRSKKKTRKTSKRSKKSKSRSRSASASASRSQSKSPSRTDSSFISKKSEQSAKPSMKKNKQNEGSKTPKSIASSRGKSRSASQSGNVSPAMATALKSGGREKQRLSRNKDSSAHSSKKNSLYDLEQRLESDRLQREQKIKKLVKKTKIKEHETPTFQLTPDSKLGKTKKSISKTSGLAANKENKDQNVRKLSSKK